MSASLSLSSARDLVQRPGGMDEVQARGLLELLLGGSLAVEDGGQLLAALAARGETGVEVAAVAQGMLERATVIPVSGACLDLCGTGGSGRQRYNVSTSAAFLLAATGARVAKHGNRGSVRPNGSFDLLDALGVPFALPPAAHAQLLESTGVCFLFARAMHPAMAAVAPYRKAAGRRTIFNLAGPLANPCRPRRQLIGAASAGTAAVVAEALTRLGVERALVVVGEPGIDEVSVSGATHWIEVGRAGRRAGVWRHPRWSVPYESLPAGDAAANAAVFAELIAGRAGAALQAMVLANAGAALDLWRDRAVFAGEDSLAEVAACASSPAFGAAYERHRAAARAAERQAQGAVA
jgi:anthranilate phosphoribosyltransferase